MGLPTLKTKERVTFGKASAKKLRKEGRIPSVIYGQEKEPIHVVLDPRDLERVFRKNEKGKNTMIELEVETEKGTKKEIVLTYQIQSDAITRAIEHIDFIRTSDKTKISAVVPIELEGQATGLKMGGVLIHKLREIVIKSLPQDIPVSIKVDIGTMNIGDFFKVKDLTLGSISIVSNIDDTIVRIAAPRTAVEIEESLAEDTEEEGEGEGDVSETEGGTSTDKSSTETDSKQ